MADMFYPKVEIMDDFYINETAMNQHQIYSIDLNQILESSFVSKHQWFKCMMNFMKFRDRELNPGLLRDRQKY